MTDVIASIAHRVVTELRPTVALVLGDDARRLTEALRQRGVEAASARSLEEAYGSGLGPVDLLVWVEPPASPPDADALRAFVALCETTDDALLVSREAPVHGRSCWSERFAEQGFYLDVEFDAAVPGASTLRFRTAPAVRREVNALRRGAEARDARIAALNSRIVAMEGTRGWRVLQRLRRARHALAPVTRACRKSLRAVSRSVQVLVAEGPSVLAAKVGAKARRIVRGRPIWDEVDAVPDLDAQYRVWLEQNTPGVAELARLARTSEQRPAMPLVSLVLTAREIDEARLRSTLDSVRAQVHGRWELATAVAGPTPDVLRAVLEEYAGRDTRILPKVFSNEDSLAAAVNAAVAATTGDLVAFLDSDDLLAPEALLEMVAHWTGAGDLDLVYSDADVVTED